MKQAIIQYNWALHFLFGKQLGQAIRLLKRMLLEESASQPTAKDLEILIYSL
jgi:hypothetical protein